MPDTVAGLFRTRSEAQEALRKLKDAGFGPDQVSLATPRAARRGHYGSKVLLGVAAGDRGLYYEQEVESGRFLVSVAGPNLQEAAQVLRDAGAMESAPIEAPIQADRPHVEGG